MASDQEAWQKGRIEGRRLTRGSNLVHVILTSRDRFQLRPCLPASQVHTLSVLIRGQQDTNRTKVNINAMLGTAQSDQYKVCASGDRLKN